MQSHSTGAIAGTRIGSLSTQQGFSLDYANNLTGVPVKLCTIPGTPAKPIAYSIRAVVVVPNNGATAPFNLGTAPNGQQFLAAVDLKAAANTNYVPIAAQVGVAIADVEVWAQVNSTGVPTAGQTVVLIHVAEVNIKQPNNQGD